MKTVNSKHEKTRNRISYVNKSLGSQDCSISKELSTLAWRLSFYSGTLIKEEGKTQFNKVVLWYPYAYANTHKANRHNIVFISLQGPEKWSVIKSTHCTSREHKISSQQPHQAVPHLLVIPALLISCNSSDICGHQHTLYVQT